MTRQRKYGEAILGTEESLAREKLKSTFLDGGIDREAFIVSLAELGASAAGYAWLNESNPGATRAPVVTAIEAAREWKNLAQERSEIVPFAFDPKVDQFAWTFGGCSAILSIKPGQLIRLWSEAAFGGKIRSVKDIDFSTMDAYQLVSHVPVSEVSQALSAAVTRCDGRSLRETAAYGSEFRSIGPCARIVI